MSGVLKSACVAWNGQKIVQAAILTNPDVLDWISRQQCHIGDASVVIEMLASYGMPVGKDVFETCVWIGRFVERASREGLPSRLVYRQEIKLHICGTARAKDSNIRQALIDRLGAPGTKRAPGPTYGISGDCWAALAVAVFATDTQVDGVASKAPGDDLPSETSTPNTECPIPVLCAKP